jgi:purine-binding chemotaxis protein CheW
VVQPERELFCFRLGDFNMAVPSENVREVTRIGPLTPLPRAPAFLMGIFGHRGEVLPVLDLLRFLSKGEARIHSRSRILVGVAGSYVTAVVADSVIGLRKVRESEILPPPMGGDVPAEYLLGVVKPEVNTESLILIAFAKVLQAARQRAVAR